MLGNNLAILSGIASPTRANEMFNWIKEECTSIREKGEFVIDLPQNFFSFVKPEDPEWNERYAEYNKQGDYQNAGIWPFVSGIYIAALVVAKKYTLAREKLEVLSYFIKISRTDNLKFGFNEWIKVQDGKPMGQDWQSWSSALYLYSA